MKTERPKDDPQKKAVESILKDIFNIKHLAELTAEQAKRKEEEEKNNQ